jgi:hypothetical protein
MNIFARTARPSQWIENESTFYETRLVSFLACSNVFKGWETCVLCARSFAKTRLLIFRYLFTDRMPFLGGARPKR